jgi:hypothetical protein
VWWFLRDLLIVRFEPTNQKQGAPARQRQPIQTEVRATSEIIWWRCAGLGLEESMFPLMAMLLFERGNEKKPAHRKMKRVVTWT